MDMDMDMLRMNMDMEHSRWCCTSINIAISLFAGIGPTRGLRQSKRGKEVSDVITLGSITACDAPSAACGAAVVTDRRRRARWS